MAGGAPAPRWMLGLGSVASGTETELVRKSWWVVPERLLAGGYTFAFPGWSRPSAISSDGASCRIGAPVGRLDRHLCDIHIRLPFAEDTHRGSRSA